MSQSGLEGKCQCGPEFIKAVNSAEKDLAEKRWGRNASVGLCGPDSAFLQLVAAQLRNTCKEPDCGAALANGLARLDRLLESVTLEDSTIPHRWATLSRIARAVVVGRATAKGRRLLNEAKESFDTVWNTTLPPDLGTPPTVWAESRTATVTDPTLFGQIGEALAPWTPGAWMVWDALTQLNGTAPASATEKTWVLFGDGKPLAIRLVVEALPGPAGLVTPDWWRIGLSRFPTGPSNFVLATQQAMLWVAAENPGHRLRWYLEPDTKFENWIGLTGRSGMAAATAVALAVFERLDPERKPQNDDEPILDERMAITAEVDAAPSDEARSRVLVKVDETSLQHKFEAAEMVGIDTVFVATGQPVPNNAKRPTVEVTEVDTVEKAVESLRNMQQVFDNYAEYVRSQFRYFEDPAPTP